MKHSFVKDHLKRKKNILFNSMLIDTSFYPVCEFVFCNKLDRTRGQSFDAKVA